MFGNSRDRPIVITNPVKTFLDKNPNMRDAVSTAVFVETVLMGKVNKGNVEKATGALFTDWSNQFGSGRRAIALALCICDAIKNAPEIGAFFEHCSRVGFHEWRKGTRGERLDPEILNQLITEGLIKDYFIPTPIRGELRAIGKKVATLLEQSTLFSQELRGILDPGSVAKSTNLLFRDLLITLIVVPRYFIDTVWSQNQGEPMTLNGPPADVTEAASWLILHDALHALGGGETGARTILALMQGKFRQVHWALYTLDSEQKDAGAAKKLAAEDVITVLMRFNQERFELQKYAKRFLGEAVTGISSDVMADTEIDYFMSNPPRYPVSLNQLIGVSDAGVSDAGVSDAGVSFGLNVNGSQMEWFWEACSGDDSPSLCGVVLDYDQKIVRSIGNFYVPLDATDLGLSPEEYTGFCALALQSARILMKQLMVIWEEYPALYGANFEGRRIGIKEGMEGNKRVLNFNIPRTFVGEFVRAMELGEELLQSRFPDGEYISFTIKTEPLGEDISEASDSGQVHDAVEDNSELDDRFMSRISKWQDFKRLLINYGVKERTGKGSHVVLSFGERKIVDSSNWRNDKYPISRQLVRRVLRALGIPVMDFIARNRSD